MSAIFFIAGTDTGVGKTTVAAALLRVARDQGLSTAACKPIASGCVRTPEGLRNDDALALLAQCSLPLEYAEVNPLAFEPAIAPHLAAREVGQALSVAALEHAVRHVQAYAADLTLVEGAGGWRVPLTPGVSLAELPRRLGLPVILVVGVRLGCINHALLSAEAIRADGLHLAGWVANLIEPATERIEDNLDTLAYSLEAPCLGVVPFMADADAARVAGYLRLPDSAG